MVDTNYEHTLSVLGPLSLHFTRGVLGCNPARSLQWKGAGTLNALIITAESRASQKELQLSTAHRGLRPELTPCAWQLLHKAM